MKLGDVIRTRRKELGFSQEALAKRAGIAQQTVGKIENNKTFQPNTLPKIAKALGWKVEELQEKITELDPPSPATAKQSGPRNRKGRSRWPFIAIDYRLYDDLSDQQKIEAEVQVFAVLKRIAAGSIVPASTDADELLRRKQ